MVFSSMAVPLQKFMHEEEELESGSRIRYLPLHHVYSATSPCVSATGSSNVMSKKVKARMLIEEPISDSPDDSGKKGSQSQKPPIIHVYTRRAKRPRHCAEKLPFVDSVLKRVKSESKRTNGIDISEDFGRNRLEASDIDDVEDGGLGENRADESGVAFNMVKTRRILKKDKKAGKNELIKLGVDSSVFCSLDGPSSYDKSDPDGTRSLRLPKSRQITDRQKVSSGSFHTKRWVELGFEDVKPNTFIGLQCKVYWPLDDEWYSGRIVGYNSETNQHQVEYTDGDAESLILSDEKVRFFLSREEMQGLNLRCSNKNVDIKGLDYSEMVVLAAGFDDCEELEPGDIIWAKLTGHAMWPAIVLNEAHISARKGLKPTSAERSIPVQFFGTHDFARIRMKQVMSFLKGLLSFFHLKCKKTHFCRSLEEAKMYLSEQKLPKGMLRLQNNIRTDDFRNAIAEEGSSDSDVDVRDEGSLGTLEGIKTCPLELGDLRVISLGKIVRDSVHFQDERYIWPEGYIAERKFTSMSDPSISTFYKMEVLRDAESKFRPLFRVTADTGEQFKGATPSACWNKIYRRIRKIQDNLSNGISSRGGVHKADKSGSYMFGFSNHKVFDLIQQELLNSRVPSKYSGHKFPPEFYGDLPAGYRPVHIDWKDLDKCSVCHMDEEYEDNLFLQCDKCRMMVHARCYGELEPVDGVIWLCNLCGHATHAKHPPLCCLCPVIGGAMKPTIDGRWAHLACAIWIPETCLSDVKRMEPIDGLNRINKDRWKLLCSICGVSYGACIQCSNSTCRVAYHPLCARAAGLCVELEDEDRLYLMSMDDDEDDQCIRLLSFCKRHRQPSNERCSPSDEQTGQLTRRCSDYNPPCNPSGCARTEPYDFRRRRGRKEPEALAAASLKRLYVENRPYLVTGYCQNGSLGNVPSANQLMAPRLSSRFQYLRKSQLETPKDILSVAEKYKYMRETFKKRLAFGKSGIHGFGIFTKQPHRAGDMVIEYTGELVRPPIADRRENFIYNSLVGAGTYMFRIDDERVIDATRAGSIAHLINHSCEPNCYSRVMSVHGDEHIIIFAKRDINQWEELTYDYRFFSIDEQLACYCGFPKCRGVVNDTDAEERMTKLHVPRTELIDWRGE